MFGGVVDDEFLFQGVRIEIEDVPVRLHDVNIFFVVVVVVVDGNILKLIIEKSVFGEGTKTLNMINHCY